MLSENEIKKFETSLNSMDPAKRGGALAGLKDLAGNGEIPVKQTGKNHNMHCHTFFSYNGYGFSPSRVAWHSKKEGFFAAGIVDFDTLDGADEFLKACSLLDIRGICGMETRVFIPELADKEINSPGEPGISYHMGSAFPSGQVPAELADFASGLKRTASGRTRDIVRRVNKFLAPVELDFEKDAASLTPAGNVTERHVCEAYALKAEKVFTDKTALIKFWSEKLSVPEKDAEKLVSDTVKLQAQIRAKTMKSGGPGYVNPDPSTFPTLKDMNAFSLKSGAVPTITWLSGDSAGEKDADALVELHIAQGAVMANIIPDRNWNFSDPQVKEKKVANLNKFIAACVKRDIPIIVGTEMNAPGLKLVDDLFCDALAPHLDTFLSGAAVSFAHTWLQRENMGLLSGWANSSFRTTAEKIKFFAELGTAATPSVLKKIKDRISKDSSPADILSAAKKAFAQ
jgi:hypothetical protein